MNINVDCCLDEPRCMRCRMLHIAFASDLVAIRFFLSLGAIFVGIGFLWPSQIFPDPQHLTAGARTTYLYMAQMAPEWTWGALFFVQGVVMLWSLLNDHRSKVLLVADAILGCVLWSTAIISCYAAYWPGWAHIADYRMPAIMGGELATVFASWWVMVRYNYDQQGAEHNYYTDNDIAHDGDVFIVEGGEEHGG